MTGETTRTGSFPAISERPSPLPAPPPGSPERDTWIEVEVRRSRRDAQEALAGIERLEDSLGFSPDPARGIKEGRGLLGQLSVLIGQNDRKEQSATARRNMLVGIGIGVGILGGLAGLIRIAWEMFHH